MAKFKLPKHLENVNLVRILKLDKYKRTAIFVIAIAIVVAANIVLSPVPLRLDLSRNKAYSLSPSTKKILSNLDAPVKLTFYMTSDLPPQFLPIRKTVRDMLEEYKRAGGSKIQITVVDPKNDEKARQQAAESGIPELKFSQMEQDSYAVSSAYFGLVLQHNNKKETIPQLSDLGNLEFNITSKIYKMSRKDTAKIGVMGLSQVLDQNSDPIGALRAQLNEQFTVAPVMSDPVVPTDQPEQPTIDPQLQLISPDIKAVLLFGDEQAAYSEADVAKVKTYLDKGGKVIAFANGVGVSELELQPQAATHNLFGLFSQYGITLNKNFVLSQNAELVNFGSGVVSFMTPYPLWVRTNVVHTGSPYFGNVSQVTYPWTSSLNITEKKGLRIIPIIQSTEQSWSQEKDYKLDPETVLKTPPTGFNQYILGASSQNEKGGQLIVIPSSRFIMNQYLSRETGNLDFVLNVINEFASQGALTGIRQRAVFLYPLPQIPNSQKDVYKYTNMLLLPLIFAACGAIYLTKRK